MNERIIQMKAAFRQNHWGRFLQMAEEASFDEQAACLFELLQTSHFNTPNISKARQIIWAMPRQWVLEHIEAEAEPILAVATYWEYRRLLELCAGLEEELTQRLARRAVLQADAEIQEAGQDFLTEATQGVSGEEPNSLTV